MNATATPAHERQAARLYALLNELTSLPRETEWAEFKMNNSELAMVGERVSALANGARLHDKEFGYLIWGVEDETHRLIGTTFDPDRKEGNQPYKLRLMQKLAPAPALAFHELQLEDRRFVILQIPAANELPVAFENIPRIRLGSATPPLRDYPEIEKRLIAKLRSFVWEKGVAAEFLDDSEILDLLDYEEFFVGELCRALPRQLGF